VTNDFAGAHHEVDLAGAGVGNVNHEVLIGRDRSNARCRRGRLGIGRGARRATKAVGATATSPAAAIPLRATFKKPYERCLALPVLLVDPRSWDRSEAPLVF